LYWQANVMTTSALRKVRLTGGTHRGSKLQVLDLPGLRPTPDRVRETVFNWLQGRVNGTRCLDLFAGSGALTFEAASRGAAQVIAVEHEARCAQLLRQEANRLKFAEVNVLQGDAQDYLARAHDPFHIIFLDPPYVRNCWADCLRLIADRRLLAADGLLYLEWPTGQSLPFGAPWQVHREARAGRVQFALLQLTHSDPNHFAETNQ
jgi:16S rRNA (guanine966-N2)-methyltransferase